MDWIKTLATVAPSIATALGGPLAGVATKAVTEMLGIEPTEEALESAVLNADPTIMLKLKEAENSFLLKMKELDVDVERIDAGDRDSARKMRTETGSMTTDVIGTIVVIGFFVVVGLVLAGVVPTESVLAGTVIGYTSAKADQVLGFLFGSSKSSKDKTLAMSKLIKSRD